LIKAIEDGSDKQTPKMPPFKEKLTPEQIRHSLLRSSPEVGLPRPQDPSPTSPVRVFRRFRVHRSAGVAGEFSDTVVSTGAGCRDFISIWIATNPEPSPSGPNEAQTTMPITSVTSFMISAPNDFAF